MDTKQLFDNVEKQLAAYNIKVAGWHRNGPVLASATMINMPSGESFGDFTLRVGKLAASEYIDSVDLMILREDVRDAVAYMAPFRLGVRVAVFRPTEGRNSYFLEVVLMQVEDQCAVLSLKLEDEYFDEEYVEVLFRLGKQPTEKGVMMRRALNGVVVTFLPIDHARVPDEGVITMIRGETPEPDVAYAEAWVTIGDVTFRARHIQTYDESVLNQ